MTAARGVAGVTAAGADGTPRTVTERQSLIVVGVAHLVLLAALSLALRSVTPPPPRADAVAVEIVSDAPAGAPPPPAPAPPEPKPEAAAPPPAPAPPEPKVVEEPAPQPEVKPEPKPEPEKPQAEKPKPEKPRPEKPRPDRPKPEKAKPAKPAPLDTDALEAQLDRHLPKPKAKPLDTAALSKALDAAAPKPKTRALDTAALSKSLDASLPRGAPKAARGDPRAAAALAAAIRAQVTPCWNLPVGAATAGKVTALLHIDINRDGTVAGRPGLVSQTGLTGANADYARAFAETAKRAVLRCSPLKLPADQYDQWKAVEINFDPTEM